MSSLATFLLRSDRVFHSGRVGLLCNQTSFDFESGKYLFQLLSDRGSLHRLFLPEHGLFAELQDQIPLSETKVYSDLGLQCDIVSLYGNSESTLVATERHLSDLDAIVIDVLDIGVRYYTFSTSMLYLFETLRSAGLSIPVYVLDKPNPCGYSVEGTVLDKSYASFVGPPGLVHRHGMTLGDLARFFYTQCGATFPLEIIPGDGQSTEIPFMVAPSPNMPGPYSQLVYSGQCLLEGTNLSEGRGTTRPFEIFGAPYLQKLVNKTPPVAPGAVLRPLRFIPTFHKHANEICYGYQIQLNGASYHSLLHTMQLLRWIADECKEFAWRTGPYEFRSDRPAIELLAGDPVLLNYLYAKESLNNVKEHLRESEDAWKKKLPAGS